ncbi:D-alanine aminotransferase [Alteromonadaceae bacterium M269]|nr:D-alanine aminotransferase [Alteromonadaceae bacterium M269]
MQQTVYLNDQFMPLEQAKISPLDRGFLFGDGVYEVIPSYSGKFVGFDLHIERLKRSLAAIKIELNWTTDKWRSIAERLLEENGSGNLSVYIHVSRGADVKRAHAYKTFNSPTVFALTTEIPAPKVANIDKVEGLSVVTQEDIRWQRCDVKSTALLGNIMHFQHAYDQGVAETILYNKDRQVTEASTSNVFVIKNNCITTPPLDSQLLPGVTRHIVLDIIRSKTQYEVGEEIVTFDDLKQADEVWLTSASKEVAPVTLIDGDPVADGKVGGLWLAIMSLFEQHKFDA